MFLYLMIIVILLIFTLILIIDNKYDDEILEAFGLGSWIKKKAKKAKDALKKVGNAITHPGDTLKKIGNTFTHSKELLAKLGDPKALVDKVGSFVKNPIKGLTNISNKLDIPEKIKTGLHLNSHADHAIDSVEESLRPKKTVIQCKGAHLYSSGEECPDTRPYKWGQADNGICCNSFKKSIY